MTKQTCFISDIY